MAFPSTIRRQYSFTGFAQGLGNGTFAGTQLDTDLDQTNNAINDITGTLRTLIRADGKLANGSVGRNALAADVAVGFGPSRPWAAGTAYTLNDTVTRGTGLYRALTANVGSDPAGSTGTWEFVADLSQAMVVADGAITREKIGLKAVAHPQLEDRAVDARVLGIGQVDPTHAAPSLGIVPVGTMVEYAGISPPLNWRFANGDYLVRSAYPALFEALTSRIPCDLTVGSATITNLAVPLGGYGLIGAAVEGPGIPAGTFLGAVAGNQAVLSNPATQSGTQVFLRFCPYGNGADGYSFQLPDTRGRMIAGRDDMGGGAAGRLPSIAGDRLASVGGNEARILTLLNLPVTLPGGAVTVTYPSYAFVKYGQLDVVQPGTGTNVTNLWRNTESAQSPTPDPRTFNFGLSNPGGGQPFNVLPPVGIANRIIFAGAV
ncbi:hypothetical protein ASF22_05050 [Methylobacterium sp. Leaf87]|uniref:hypothetical protein n=1 Tax=Methylobacterium sp. Leaf87 TaxID=1736243 RepID=UPI0006F5C0EF|nr:hypothetical protein [Methylobacterium sp. Leaf87]KQO66038.1 hypothetical protein ASF22_05050 [Methylobacterium sp. Leaf87]